VADGCAAVTESGALWVVGGAAGVSRLGPRAAAWEVDVLEEAGPGGASQLEAGLAGLQGGAAQPWWEEEEPPVPRVEAWTRPSRTGIRRRRAAPGRTGGGLYQWDSPLQDRGGSWRDNFGRGWGQDPGLGPPEGRRVEVAGYPGEGGARVEQAIRGGRITYPLLPAEGGEGGFPPDPPAGYGPERGGAPAGGQWV
jgi:hypothetical protein